MPDQDSVVALTYIGPDRRSSRREDQGSGYSGPDRRRIDTSKVFADAVTAATRAASADINRVYSRQALWRTIIIAVVVSAAIALPITLLVQQSQNNAVKRAAVLNCKLVVSLTGVFGQFVTEEINDRVARSSLPNVNAQIKQFDVTVATFWEQNTVPQLTRIEATNCPLDVSTFNVKKH